MTFFCVEALIIFQQLSKDRLVSLVKIEFDATSVPSLPVRAYRIMKQGGIRAFVRKSVEYSQSHLRNALVYPAYNEIFKRRFNPGFDVMNADWDVLLLLDAARYDIMSEVATDLPSIERKVTRAVGSLEFMEYQYMGRQLHDTVYVTSNPYVSRIESDVFYAVDDSPLQEHWDPERGTVYPSDVSRVAKQAAEEYPDKRLVVHYMQPHLPPIGPTGDRLHEEFSLLGYHPNRGDDEGEDPRTEGMNLFSACRQGLVSNEDLRTTYRESLEIVFDEAKEVAEAITGRAVVSADHGEHLGERLLPGFPELYSHGNPVLSPEQCFVPWAVLKDGDRREVTTERPREEDRIDEVRANRQLRALGYTE